MKRLRVEVEEDPIDDIEPPVRPYRFAGLWEPNQRHLRAEIRFLGDVSGRKLSNPAFFGL
jgi:hypothetical protein